MTPEENMDTFDRLDTFEGVQSRKEANWTPSTKVKKVTKVLIKTTKMSIL
jgi:hypothetical protein